MHSRRTAETHIRESVWDQESEINRNERSRRCQLRPPPAAHAPQRRRVAIFGRGVPDWEGTRAPSSLHGGRFLRGVTDDNGRRRLESCHSKELQENRDTDSPFRRMSLVASVDLYVATRRMMRRSITVQYQYSHDEANTHGGRCSNTRGRRTWTE